MAHQLEALVNHTAANQDRLRTIAADGYHVQTAVQAVHEINIGMSRLAPHGLGSRGASAAKGVTGRVLYPEVGLDLRQTKDNVPISVSSNQQFAQ